MTSVRFLLGVVLCAQAQEGSWARTVEGGEAVEPVGNEVVDFKGDGVLVGENDLRTLNAVSEVNTSGNFNGGIAQKSVFSLLETFSRNLQDWSTNEEEGRHIKQKKMMMRMIMWLKTLGLGVVLPSAVALALFAAWKGITISLMALLLAGIVGLKGLVASASKSSSGGPHHVVLSGVPSHHQHYWKRSDVISDPSAWAESPHQFAYRAYT